MVKCIFCNIEFPNKGDEVPFCSSSCKSSYRRKQRPSSKDWEIISEFIFERDSYKCADCDSDENNLHVHHIIPLSQDGDNSYKNLITVCARCHTKRHAEILYGRTI